ncbi:MAG: transcription-repair coupling factor, partial [Desulfovibrio sp.]|nr:transcription-repair coupling factor [Desulfovibrio sp.]
FQLAMEDLRLRGAGNILGEVQSGQVSRVGLDLYLEMLEDAVARLKGEPRIQENVSEVNLGLPAHIPLSYMDDNRERMSFYKRLTTAVDQREREEIVLEIRDRFGPLPRELVNFVAILGFKQVISGLEVARADLYLDRVHLTWKEEQEVISPEAVLEFLARHEGARLVSAQALLIPLAKDEPFEVALKRLGQDLPSLKKAAEPEQSEA